MLIAKSGVESFRNVIVTSIEGSKIEVIGLNKT